MIYNVMLCYGMIYLYCLLYGLFKKKIDMQLTYYTDHSVVGGILNLHLTFSVTLITIL